jgi:hypothetical protein
MSLQFTGAPRVGRLQSVGRFDGFFEGVKGQQGLARAEIRARDVLVCTASGSFMALGNRERTAPLPMRKRGVDAEVAPLTVAELSDEERVVYDRARAAVGRAKGLRNKLNPNIKIIDSQTGNFTRAEAVPVMQAFLKKYKAGTDFQGVFIHNDDMGIGAIEALKVAGVASGRPPWASSTSWVRATRPMAEAMFGVTVTLFTTAG